MGVVLLGAICPFLQMGILDKGEWQAQWISCIEERLDPLVLENMLVLHLHIA